MKTWLKIFKNQTVSTPLEIMAEIKNLESEKKDAQEVFTGLQGMLENKRIDFLGGNCSVNDVKKLKGQVSDARENIKALDLALEKLQQLHKVAVAREKDSVVAGINKALLKLETDRQELVEKFIKASGKAAALSFLLRGGEVFQLSPKHTPLALTGVEKQPFYDIFNEIVNGQPPLTQKRIDLITQRTALLNR